MFQAQVKVFFRIQQMNFTLIYIQHSGAIMKKFLFISAALIIFSTLAAAQEGYIRQGMSRLSGAATFSWNHESQHEVSNNQYWFSLTPSYSYLITNNFELGGVFNLLYRRETTEFSYSSTTINYSSDYLSIGVGPAARYYFTTDNLVPFLGASYIYSSNGQQGRDEKQTMTNLNMGGGLDYFISENTALEPSITYSIYWYKDVTINQLNIGVGINYFIK